jgi:hypothetical protein
MTRMGWSEIDCQRGALHAYSLFTDSCASDTSCIIVFIKNAELGGLGAYRTRANVRRDKMVHEVVHVWKP